MYFRAACPSTTGTKCQFLAKSISWSVFRPHVTEMSYTCSSQTLVPCSSAPLLRIWLILCVIPGLVVLNLHLYTQKVEVSTQNKQMLEQPLYVILIAWLSSFVLSGRGWWDPQECLWRHCVCSGYLQVVASLVFSMNSSCACLTSTSGIIFVTLLFSSPWEFRKTTDFLQYHTR